MVVKVRMLSSTMGTCWNMEKATTKTISVTNGSGVALGVWVVTLMIKYREFLPWIVVRRWLWLKEPMGLHQIMLKGIRSGVESIIVVRGRARLVRKKVP
jgi:hypothetical protein